MKQNQYKMKSIKNQYNRCKYNRNERLCMICRKETKMSKTGETKIENTKRELLNAFCRLSREHAADEITVSMLCREADVNRTTFYKHYHVPTDVILEETQKIMEYALQYNEENHLDERKSILKLCELCYEHKELLQLYMRVSGNLAKMIFQIVQEKSEGMQFLKKKENIFLSGGITQTVCMWMVQGYQETPEEMTELLLTYIRAFRDAGKKISKTRNCASGSKNCSKYGKKN